MSIYPPHSPIPLASPVWRWVCRAFFRVTGGRPMRSCRWRAPWTDAVSGDLVRYWVDRRDGKSWMALRSWSRFRVPVKPVGPPPPVHFNCRCSPYVFPDHPRMKGGLSLSDEPSFRVLDETPFVHDESKRIDPDRSAAVGVITPVLDDVEVLTGVSAAEMNRMLESEGSTERVPDDDKTYTVHVARSPSG